MACSLRAATVYSPDSRYPVVHLMYLVAVYDGLGARPSRAASSSPLSCQQGGWRGLSMGYGSNMASLGAVLEVIYTGALRFEGFAKSDSATPDASPLDDLFSIVLLLLRIVWLVRCGSASRLILVDLLGQEGVDIGLELLGGALQLREICDSVPGGGCRACRGQSLGKGVHGRRIGGRRVGCCHEGHLERAVREGTCIFWTGSR